ncbi:TIGR03085 family metal-binding protein [Catenuloplanes atrovinosus]|uniref:Uncharacterized protein (TIGR03085 family) n=1 Tax=Catenuloplanes atrovinosus TaxID=137266 RepID=A0AAE3YQT0_9ACTN|nr:TIGR03085 family metal-binding protein [Catenuloplanes atrovinosus]MDR7278119.1 uncharacterized protein (TIGR03085 family) [Catenuloplanes atrovinosus]
MTRHSLTERSALADLLLDVGPDAPTLCTGWTTRDLAAHLVVRDRQPIASLGSFIPPLHGYGERVRLRAAALPYPELVARVRKAPWWSPTGNALTDPGANTGEFFIHHEDVRRGAPGWRPRTLDPDLDAKLWRNVRFFGALTLRRFPAALTVAAPGHGEFTGGTGGEPVRLIGAPGELVLFVSGRQRAARVQIDGPPVLADRLRTASFGL